MGSIEDPFSTDWRDENQPMRCVAAQLLRCNACKRTSGRLEPREITNGLANDLLQSISFIARLMCRRGRCRVRYVNVVAHAAF